MLYRTPRLGCLSIGKAALSAALKLCGGGKGYQTSLKCGARKAKVLPQPVSSCGLIKKDMGGVGGVVTKC